MPSKNHIEFINQIVKGSTQSEAYRISIGKKGISKPLCEAQGCKLAKKYAKEIAEAKLKAKSIVEEANNTKEAQIALKSILTQAEVDAEMCRIMMGGLVEVQSLNAQGKVFKALVNATISERKALFETYNKRFGSNEAIKIDASISQMPSPQIILSK